MESAFVPEAPEIQLQALQLDAEPVRRVRDADSGEIGLACHRADAGELRTFESDLVVPCRGRVRKRLELARRRRRAAGGEVHRGNGKRLLALHAAPVTRWILVCSRPSAARKWPWSV